MPSRPIKIELYRGAPLRDMDGHNIARWRWTARRGGRIINASSEAYTERIAAVDNIALVFGIPLRRLVKPGARAIDVNWERVVVSGTYSRAHQVIEVKTR